MKPHLLVTALAGVLATSGIAFADSYNGMVTEVSADPRDGNDYVRVDHVRARQLELVGMNDVVDLHAMTIRFDSGLVYRPVCHEQIVPGQAVAIDLPRDGGSIASIELDYGRPELRLRDRTDARLQIYAEGAYEPRVSYERPRYLRRGSTSSWGGVVTSGPLGDRYTETSLRRPNWPGK